MSEERMEEMLSSLISLVGNMNQKLQNSLVEQASFREKQTTMYEEQQAMRQEMQTMRQELQAVKKEQTIMHEKITGISNKLTDMQADQEHIWEKGARNERELA
jgi:uncharacterized coiled-coil DUF342 family protein